MRPPACAAGAELPQVGPDSLRGTVWFSRRRLCTVSGTLWRLDSTIAAVPTFMCAMTDRADDPLIAALYHVPEGWMVAEVQGSRVLQLGPLPTEPMPTDLIAAIFPDAPVLHLEPAPAPLEDAVLLQRLTAHSGPFSDRR